ncbi:hypothetical protein [Streptomyces sp. NBC_00690]|uniref:hypothetical protein n=1 Tax=Streptomyces sp. NBC_00690 TaxID=2975808 RepID=UPI002E2B6B16|nr:hypothetical protein [Streptomyces sp. NBC_00690]
MLALPTAMESNVVGCGEVLVEDTAAWAVLLGAGGGTQLVLDEVQARPVRLVGDHRRRPTSLPRRPVGHALGGTAHHRTAPDLRTTRAERRLAPLNSFIDLKPFGPTDSDARSEMAVTITAVPVMERKARKGLTRRALVHMARHFGYTDAEAGVLW